MHIDAHQHFWHYHPQEHAWINDEMAVIRKDFLPADLQPLLTEHAIDGCVAVQAGQDEKETNFLLQLANENSFIKGVVGWVDLRAEDIKDRLAYYAQFKPIKGFRHVLQGEDPSFMLQSSFKNGIAALAEFGFTYDILIFPTHLAAALQLVRKFPDQTFVIDHIAKPYIRQGLIDDWKKGITALAKHENVFCKLSGMVTEADFTQWKPADFAPYLDVVTETFGINRVMYGSDWPVCLAAASYTQMLAIVQNYFSSFSQQEQDLFFGGNAGRFYHL